MTALILRSASLGEMITVKLKASCASFLHALDLLAEAKMRRAVPAWQLRKAERDVERFRRLINVRRKSPPRKRAGR